MPSLINYIGRINFSEFHLLKRTGMGIALKWFMILSAWQMLINIYTWTRNIAKFLFLPDTILNLCVHFTEADGFDLLEIFPFYRELNIKISICSALPQTTSLGFLSSELSITLFTVKCGCGWKIHEVLSLFQQITKFGCCLFVSIRLQEQLSLVEFFYLSTPGLHKLSRVTCIPIGSFRDARTETEHSDTLSEEDMQQFNMTKVNINTS